MKSDEVGPKALAGISAARKVRSGMVVGLGTGSTAAYAVEELGRRVREEGLRIRGVPTSEMTARLARKAGVPLTTLERDPLLDIAIDGADQVDRRLNLVKGGWGAHTREKIVATAARRFIVVADPTKLSPVLKMPVPVEVIPMAVAPVLRALKTMGARGKIRAGTTTDQGNPVIDAAFGAIRRPDVLDRRLSEMVGVVDHGIFPARMVAEVHVGTAGGVRVLRKR
jgi:ribose 5-phosphate isomerase A